MSGKYIVVFKPHVSEEKIKEYVNNVNANGGTVSHEYDGPESVIKGFAATIPSEYLQSLKSLQKDNDEIDYIEPDGEVKTQ